jgi:hypothetical protein
MTALMLMVVLWAVEAINEVLVWPHGQLTV